MKKKGVAVGRENTHKIRHETLSPSLLVKTNL